MLHASRVMHETTRSHETSESLNLRSTGTPTAEEVSSCVLMQPTIRTMRSPSRPVPWRMAWSRSPPQTDVKFATSYWQMVRVMMVMSPRETPASYWQVVLVVLPLACDATGRCHWQLLLVLPPRETPASASAVLYPGTSGVLSSGTIGAPAPSASEVLYWELSGELSCLEVYEEVSLEVSSMMIGSGMDTATRPWMYSAVDTGMMPSPAVGTGMDTDEDT